MHLAERQLELLVFRVIKSISIIFLCGGPRSTIKLRLVQAILQIKVEVWQRVDLPQGGSVTNKATKSSFCKNQLFCLKRFQKIFKYDPHISSDNNPHVLLSDSVYVNLKDYIFL